VQGLATVVRTLLVTAALAGPGAAVAAGPASPLPIETFRLDNGMRFLLLPRQQMPTVEAGLVVDVGTAHEDPGATGLSHLVEHMMFKGTRTLGSLDLDRELATLDRLDAFVAELQALPRGVGSARRREALERERDALVSRAEGLVRLGAFGLEYSRVGATRLNANTALDLTLYYVTLPHEKLELWFWLESDRLREPVFRELAKEQRVVAEERRLRIDSTPTGAADRAFDEVFWADTPYARSTLGSAAHVAAATRPALRSFFERHYRPERLTAVLVGNFDPGVARRLAESYFGRLTPGTGAPAVAAVSPARVEEQTISIPCECPPQVQVRYPSVAFGHPDDAPLQLVAGLLNGRSGRLYRGLVVGREIAFAAYAQQSPLARGGSFTVGLEAKGQAPLESLVAAWDEELSMLLTVAPTEGELRRTRRRLATEHLDQLKDPHALMRRLLVYSGLGDWRLLASWSDRLSEITPLQVQAAARRYLARERRLVGYYEGKAE
jgi:predicted Zn-dependent peptidase